jgi:hypothetical protein
LDPWLDLLFFINQGEQHLQQPSASQSNAMQLPFGQIRAPQSNAMQTPIKPIRAPNKNSHHLRQQQFSVLQSNARQTPQQCHVQPVCTNRTQSVQIDNQLIFFLTLFFSIIKI